MHIRACLILAFIESFATICVERGIFFFAHRHLNFDESANLWLALSFGVPYVLGALTSHRLTTRHGERRVLTVCLVGQLLAHAVLGMAGHLAAVLVPLNILLGALNGLKWPIIESYVSAGRLQRDRVRAIGSFNIAWAIPVPLALLFAGPANVIGHGLLFWVPALLNAGAMGLSTRLPARPLHLPADHPDHPTPADLLRLQHLLAASRWLLLLGYMCMWIMSALMPLIFARLAVSDRAAPGLSGLLDVCRLAIFIALVLRLGWEARAWPLWLGAACLPAGFLLTVSAPTITAVLCGEIIFGLSIGMVYFAALYLAMTVKNAAVDAGGAHEAIIGSGFALGPAVGLVAIALEPVAGGRLAAILLGVGPFIILSLVVSARALLRTAKAFQLPT